MTFCNDFCPLHGVISAWLCWAIAMSLGINFVQMIVFWFLSRILTFEWVIPSFSTNLLFVRWCWQCTHQRGDCEHKVDICHCGSVLWWVIINKVVSWVEACRLTRIWVCVQHVSWLLMCRCLEVVVDGEGEGHVGSCRWTESDEGRALGLN
jgi:hypothetical protein